ncbi:MAG: hypothetical protein WC099_01500 [Candidatus Paceibacterota bacterium]
MNPLNKRILFIILAFLFLVAAAFTYSSFIKPSYSAVNILRSELFSKRESLLKYQNSTDQLKTIIKAGQDVTQVRDIANRVLPMSVDVSQVVAQLSGFARLNRVVILETSSQVQPARTPLHKALQGIGVVETTVKAEGGYNDFKLMFGQLENNLLVLDANKIHLERNTTEGTDLQKLNASFVVTSYYQLP